MNDTSHEHEHPNYLLIFFGLVILTGLSFLTVPLRSDMGLGEGFIICWVFGIAICKASLVALWFMNLKFEGKWKYILVIPPLFMSVFLVLALVPDMIFPFSLK
ncbi:MAG: cytochrome C oxidase subunit IV family protein [Planctomycetota bacterium]|nr:cytochrome C oxidase subunit IV family protein [Planctomycetota bacterium]